MHVACLALCRSNALDGGHGGHSGMDLFGSDAALFGEDDAGGDDAGGDDAGGDDAGGGGDEDAYPEDDEDDDEDRPLLSRATGARLLR